MFPLIALLATPATAEVVSMTPMPMDDLWVEVPVDATFTPGPPTYDDIVAMANLDDDPAVISDREREMIALLSQVLGSAPITN